MKKRSLILSAAAVILLITAVWGGVPAQKAWAGESGAFNGIWSASGKWRPLEFGEDREVITFELAGHVNLKTALGQKKNYWSECIGLWDSEAGGTSYCIWRDVDSADAAFLILSGRLVKEGVRVNGKFVGGTGSLTGLTGSLSFTWSTISRKSQDYSLYGFTKDIAGEYQIVRPEN